MVKLRDFEINITRNMGPKGVSLPQTELVILNDQQNHVGVFLVETIARS